MKLLLIVNLLLFAISGNSQTTHTVINTEDLGTGSLRDMISIANAGDIIKFDETLIANGNATITLASEIAFSKHLTFKGLYNSTDTLIVSGGNTNRIFNISNTTNKILLDSMVLINGYVTTNTESGGAIYLNDCSDTLWVLNSILSDNSSDTYSGGAIATKGVNVSTAIVIENTKLSNNNAGYAGGAIHCQTNYSSYILIYNSILSNNSCLADAGGAIFSNSIDQSVIKFVNSTVSENSSINGKGGAMFVYADDNSLITIDNSTLSNNSSISYGGGISISANYSTLLITSSTMSENVCTNSEGGAIFSECYSSSNITIDNSSLIGNSASVKGGAIMSYSNMPEITISNSTITANTAPAGASVYSESFSSNSIFSVESSIVAENGSGTSGLFHTETPTIVSNGYNIFSDAPVGYDLANDQIDISNLDLNLEPLAFNGGSTKTMKPGNGSVAINTGNPINLNNAQNGTINGIRDAGSTEACISISSFNVISCESYVVPSGDETYFESGIYIDTIPNVAGCDSLMTIDVIIKLPSYGDTSATACGTFTWYGIDYLTSGTPTHTLQNSAGCDSIITLNLIINDIPDNSITVSENNILGAGQADGDYQWIDCSDNTYIDGATAQNYEPTLNGYYAVEITKDGCLARSGCRETTIGLGINTDSFANLQLYPNPTNGEFTITTTENSVNVTVYGLDGKVILNNVIITNNQKTINLIGIESGVYFVKVSNQLNQKLVKLIVE
jgi:hypothetical protein